VGRGDGRGGASTSLVTKLTLVRPLVGTTVTEVFAS
jgi:hypothetical protein